MAQLVTVRVYRKNADNLGGIYGVDVAFPSTGIIVEPHSETISGATMATVIKALPDAAYRQTDKYYSPTAVSTIVTAANAPLA